MALGLRSRPGLDLENKPTTNAHPDCECLHHQIDPRPANKPSALNEITANSLHNLANSSNVESLTADLDSFHIRSPTKENAREKRQNQKVALATATASEVKHRGVYSDTLAELAGVKSDCSSNGLQGTKKAKLLQSASHNIPPHEEQLEKLQAGQFEWVLTVPASDRSVAGYKNSLSNNDGEPPQRAKRLRFGSTRIEGDAPKLVAEPLVVQETDSMSTTELTNADTTVIQLIEPRQEELSSPRRTSEVTMAGKNDDIVEQIISLPPARPFSRIEDSVEALDQLEDDLEALNEVARLKVLPPEETKNLTLRGLEDALAPASASVKRTDSATKRPATRTGVSTVRVRTTERTSSVRRSSSMTFSKEEGKHSAPAESAPTKPRVTRPASLLPPKPPAKSTKPPTMPTFELPGEAVARRLKEQREARRSQQISSEQAAALAEFFSPSRPHAKSTKPPTKPTFELPGESVARRLKEQREARRSQQVSSEQAAALAEFFSPSRPHAKSAKPPTKPTFELPGEAISRRKREEREAKLRAQEEEERRRREFKARPVRSSIAPSNYPRETLASRARQSKVFPGEASPEAPSAGKRLSIVRTSTTRATASPGKAAASLNIDRGRTSKSGSPSLTQLSRATSTSTGSIHGSSSGKRSNVSGEEVAQRKLRGKEIYNRDNSYAAERDRERRDREEATRLARQEAAERSRQLSREWAEKQRAKVLSAKMQSSAAAKAY